MSKNSHAKKSQKPAPKKSTVEKKEPTKRASATTSRAGSVEMIIARARAMAPDVLAPFLEAQSPRDLRAIHEEVAGTKTSGRASTAKLVEGILGAMAVQTPTIDESATTAPESKPLEEALAESPAAAVNASSWDSALPEPGYVPPPGTGEEDAADGEHGDEEPPPAETGEPVTAAASSAPPARERDPRIPPVGSVLAKRDRSGLERARCTIVDGGVEYAGTVYKSLSSAAIAAAKDLGLASKTQDGFAFWQLKKASAPRAKDPVAALELAWERYRVAAAAKIDGDEQRAKIRGAIHQHLTALNQLAGEIA